MDATICTLPSAALQAESKLLVLVHVQILVLHVCTMPHAALKYIAVLQTQVPLTAA